MMLFEPIYTNNTTLQLTPCPPCLVPPAAEDYEIKLANLSPKLDLADVPAGTGQSSMGSVFWGAVVCVFIALIFGCCCTALKVIRG